MKRASLSKKHRRIERLARTAALLRLRGQVARAEEFDRVLGALVDGSGRSRAHEERGRQRGSALHQKLTPRRKSLEERMADQDKPTLRILPTKP